MICSKKLLLPLLSVILSLYSVSTTLAQTTPDGATPEISDPLDPFDFSFPLSDGLSSSDNDKDKSATDLIQDATILLSDERLLDARTKLLKAIQKDPKEYRAYSMLAGYYMVHVGHFRLALKYIKQAIEIFIEKNGKPPYSTPLLQFEHSNLLYYLSQIRLNLDNYQGALDTLDEYNSYGYYDSWYPGSRSWMLMKLGRIEEAIRVARMGLLADAEPGRTLNMLGILLSMTGESDEAIQVFRQAISLELSLGDQGQAATPLNNVGEVYKEKYEEDKAESAWLRATSLPDGCEHVLPSLNLTLLYIDQLRLEDAKKAMDRFEQCVAQFPLRNNEEHVALVHLARGRIALHSGDVDDAISHFEAALQGVQWFGKIGTNEDDMKAAGMISLAQALRAKNNLLKLHVFSSWSDWIESKKARSINQLRAWWLLRRCRQQMIEDQNNLEDIQIRNTDSLIEYPTLGDLLVGIPKSAFLLRLDNERKIDSRGPSANYYNAYEGQRLLDWWDGAKGVKLLESVLNTAREKYDALLYVQTSIQLIEYLGADSEEGQRLILKIFEMNRPTLRNFGLKLPVNLSQLSSELKGYLLEGPFSDGGNGSPCAINSENAGKQLRIKCSTGSLPEATAKGETPEELVNELADTVFKVQLRS